MIKNANRKNFFRLALFPLILFLLVGVVSGHETAGEKGTGVITGQLLIKGGGPLSGGMVFFFDNAAGPPPSQDRYWRIPDQIGPIDLQGRFSVELATGTYYLGAIKRVAENVIGPPADGDYFYIDTNDDGSPKAYSVRKGEQIDIGVRSNAVPFKRSTVKLKEGITGIEGTILDGSGKPVQGVFVYASFSPAVVGKPLFISDKTGPDGKYLLRVHEGGRFYLKARDTRGGGPPNQGEAVGSYGEESMTAVTVKRNTITKGIDITISRFPGRGPPEKE